MSKRIAVIVGAIVLWNCQGKPADPYLVHCRATLQHAIASPATLVVKEERRETSGRTEDALITFDAANTFGAPVRDVVTCRYEAPMASERVIPTAIEMKAFTIGGRVYKAGDLQLMDWETQAVGDLLRAGKN
jgi:hypothetical protein